MTGSQMTVDVNHAERSATSTTPQGQTTINGIVFGIMGHLDLVPLETEECIEPQSISLQR